MRRSILLPINLTFVMKEPLRVAKVLAFSLNCWTQDSLQVVSTTASDAAKWAKIGTTKKATPQDTIFVLVYIKLPALLGY
jgi:hypothetical protein